METTGPKRKLVPYGGQGYSYSDENGLFHVETREETKEFVRLSEARAYFDAVEGEKSLWDFTRLPELLESYHYVNE